MTIELREIIGALTIALAMIGCRGTGPGESHAASEMVGTPGATGSNQDSVTAFKLEILNLADGQTCPNDAYLIGTSHEMAVECVADGKPPRRPEDKPSGKWVFMGMVGPSPRLGSYDWAPKRMKLECPIGSYAAGMCNAATTDRLGNRWPRLGIWCVQATARSTELNAKTDCTTVSFDRKTDHRPLDGTSRDIDFDPGVVKGQCPRGSYIAGVGYWESIILAQNKPTAILCCKW